MLISIAKYHIITKQEVIIYRPNQSWIQISRSLKNIISAL